MKLTKNELESINNLIELLEKFKKGEHTVLTYTELKHINKNLGIDLLSNLPKKKNIKKLKRGKEDCLIAIENKNCPENWMKQIYTHLHFPFQIKELKE